MKRLGSTPPFLDDRGHIDAHVAPNERPGLAIAAELVARGSTWVRGCGNSMAPTIQDGDRVLLRTVPVDRLRRGDVVVVAVRQAAVLHRIHRIHAGGLVETVGDGRLSGDGVFAPDHVLGVAVLAERNSSRVTLRSTLEFGVVAYLRGIALLGRLRFAQWWRRSMAYWGIGGSRL